MNAVRVAPGKPLSRIAACALLCVSLFAAAARAEISTAAAPAARAPLALDLGEGLGFFRVHELPADLPPAAAKPAPLVLDLRFATTKDSAATALDAWLKFRATATTPVFVLLNAATAADLRNVFSTARPRIGVLTLGPSSPDYTPDIVIPADAEDDQRAYDALEHGAEVASVLTEAADKPRQDEAALVRERTNQTAEPAALADDPAAATDDAENSAAAPKPEPAIDRPLQRAVQVHRALVALKRL